MKKARKIPYGIAVVAVVVLQIFWSLPVSAQEISLEVIGNEQSVPKTLSMRELKQVLRGEKMRWNDGQAIRIALMKTNTPSGTATCQRIYNMTAHELNKYFLALVFQGKIKAPTLFNTPGELIDYVSQTPGAIGVLEYSENSGATVIEVDGKKQL